MVPMSDVTDELDDSPILEEVLGDALGITIELEERESSVGAFSLDILARDQDSAKRSRLKTKSSNQTMSIWEN